MLLSVNYLSRALISRDLVLSIKDWVSTGLGLDVQEWEIMLHASFEAHNILHVTDVLIHQAAQQNDDLLAQAGAMLERYHTRLGLNQPSAMKTADGWRIAWNSTQPLISIIIPNKNS